MCLFENLYKKNLNGSEYSIRTVLLCRQMDLSIVSDMFCQEYYVMKKVLMKLVLIIVIGTSSIRTIFVIGTI